MILDSKSICKEISKDTDFDLEMLLSINNIVFKEISNWTTQPTHLKVYLKHFGSWFFKKKKTKDRVLNLQQLLNNNPFDININREKIFNKIKNYDFILSEYDKYVKDRYEIKCKKYGKEAYEAYCLVKKQEKIQKSKKDKPI